MPNRYGFTPPLTIQDPAHYHHDPAATWESPAGDLRVVPIEKCMSGEIRHWCEHNGWRPRDRWRTPFEGPYVVVLRDPVERWCSALRMYLRLRGWDWHQKPDPLALRVIEDCMVTDEHTEPQHRRLVGLRVSRIRAVDMSHQPHEALNRLLHTRRFSGDTRDPTIRPPWLQEWLDAGLRERIHLRYDQDYWLRLWLLDSPVPGSVLAQRRAT